MTKRTFIANSAWPGFGTMMGLSATGKEESLVELPADGGAADDENFWKQVRSMYKVKPESTLWNRQVYEDESIIARNTMELRMEIDN